MASIHKHTESPYWMCAFRLPDGRRTIRSTKIFVQGKDREETKLNQEKAWRICLDYEQATRDAQQGRLAEGQAREIIGRIYQIANNETLPQSTVKDYLGLWLKGKERTLKESSLIEYRNSVEALLAHLGRKAEKHLDTITLRDLTSFRDAQAQRVSGTTVNKMLGILRGAWIQAMKDGLIRDNTLVRVDFVKENKSKRRAFTMDEIQRILAACDGEWRGMVLCGLYLGQRLGDIAALTWRNVDLQEKEVRLITQKTGREMKIPLHPVLDEYFLALTAPDDLDAAVFPKAAATAAVKVATLSNQFADILASAGLQKKQTHDKKEDGKGRDTERKLSRLSFHCTRHTATSLLKNAGVSDVVAREIIGHDSPEISRVYTHIEKPALKDAMNKLPDVTKTKK